MKLQLAGFSLGKFRLAYQIGIIGAIALIGFVVVGAVYVTSTKNLQTFNEQAKHDAEAAVLAQQIKYGFLNARRREKDFLIRLSAKYIDGHNKVSEQVVTQIADLSTAYDDTEFAKNIAGVAEDFATYRAQFASVADSWNTMGLDEKSGLRGALRKSVKEAEELLAQYDSKELTVLMLMMRRHEKDFLARIDPKYVGRIAKRSEEFAAAMTVAPIPVAAKEEIAAKMASYVKDFNTLAKLRLELVGETKKLSKIFAQSEPKFDAVLTFVETQETSANTAAAATEQRAFILIGASVIVTAIAVALLCFFVGLGIVKAIRRMTDAMRALADGDLEIEVPAQDRGDEIGEMSGAVQVFKDNAIHAKQLEAEQEENERRAEAEKREAMIKLADQFETSVGEVVERVSTASTEMLSSSESMSATAEQTTRQSAAVAAASDEASANVQTVASATEELSSSISEISRQVTQASQVSSAAVQEADETNTKIQGLAEAANKIGEVVALITDIADQTNLLALNATIEAARAGDAGKGFAVVASEVKNLANQTAKATDEIGTQIAGIQTSTQDAVEAIEKISKTISEVNDVASSIASAVEEQGAATQEIARNVEQAATGTQEVSSNITGVNAAANDTGAAATQIKGAAGELSQQSETLRAEVSKFLNTVRTA